MQIGQGQGPHALTPGNSEMNSNRKPQQNPPQALNLKIKTLASGPPKARGRVAESVKAAVDVVSLYQRRGDTRGQASLAEGPGGHWLVWVSSENKSCTNVYIYTYIPMYTHIPTYKL